MESLNLGYWLFSTLVQAAAVLLVGVGIFILFKIHLLRESAAPFLETVKDAYAHLQNIERNPLCDEYRRLSFYAPEEMGTRIRELIAEKENEINRARKELEEREKAAGDTAGFNDTIAKLIGEISICKEKLRNLEEINQDIAVIRLKGKKSLRNICFVFFASLIALFLVPFIAEGPIIILSLVFVGIAMLIVIDLAIIVTHSIDTK